MRIIPIEPQGFEANSYLVLEKCEAMLIDAGAPAASVSALLQSENARLTHILLTHAHFDHTISAKRLAKEHQCPIYVAEGDSEMLGDPSKNGLWHLMGYGEYTDFGDVEPRKLEDTFTFADIPVRVLHTPGHSKGSCCILIENALFTGDTLFDGGFGRYDLYGGDSDTLKKSLRSLRTLTPSLKIYPGHGNTASLGSALSEIAFFIS